MRLRTFSGLLLPIFCAAVLSLTVFASDQEIAKASDIALQSRSLPLSFEPNVGQSDAHVRFIGRGATGTAFLTDDGLVLTGQGPGETRSIRIHLLASGKSRPGGEKPTGGVVNYYRTRDRKNWLTGIPIFKRVRYARVYPGVDVIFHGNDGALEYDLEIAPGSSPQKIALAVEGATKMSVAEDGGLEIYAGKQKWHLLAPAAYQVRDGVKQPVPATYQITGAQKFKFAVGAYDRSTKLVIDPVVEYSKVIGLNNDTQVNGMALDVAGNLYIAGTTFASDYPVVNGQPGKFPAGSTQVYLTKVNPAGDSILFSTYIPCSGFSRLDGLRVDANGNAYLIGEPGGSDFPVTTTALGTSGGFLAKFAGDGTMAYSSIVGGTFPRGLRVDNLGNAYLVGEAGPTLQTTAGAFQPAPPCPTCGAKFFAKVDPTGTAYIFASYFYDPATATLVGATAGVNPGIALDPAGNIFLMGQGNSATVPHVKPWQIGGGLFLAKFSPDGKTLEFSTDLGGGSSSEQPVGLEVGSDGTVFVVGNTKSNDYPYSINAAGHPVLPDGDLVTFASAIDPALNGFTYSTYVASGSVSGVFLDGNNHLYLSGSATRILPPQNSIVSDIKHSATGFFTELDAAGNPVKVSRFGGHLTDEIPTAITADAAGNIFIAGATSPQNENPQPDPILVGPSFSSGLTGGNFGLFFAKISPTNAPQMSLNSLGFPFMILRNAGSADLHISSMTFSGGRTWGNCGAILPTGTSCIITVSDSQGRLASGTLTITGDAQPAVVTANIVVPVVDVGQPIGDLLWFDDDLQNLPPRGQQTVPFHISNVGAKDSVINLITTSSTATQTNDCGTGLVPGASCTVQLTLPDGGSTLNVFSDNGSFRDFQFFVPQVTQNPLLSTNTIIFPNQIVGGVLLPRTVTVTNTGGSDIPVSSVLTGDPEYTIAGSNCPALLPAGQSCAVGLLFTPVVDGFRSAVLNIDSSNVQLGGRGQIDSVVQVSPLEQDFFPTVVHLASETFPVTLTNTVSTAAPITGIEFSLSDYSETDDCAGQVPANGSCTVQVKFVPQAVGSRNGTMTVNFTGATTQVLTLTGEGVTPFVINSHNLNFSAPVGGTSPEQGDGMGNRLFVSEGYTFTLTGPFSIAQNPCPQPMPPNGTFGCAPTIVFQPTTPGSQLGTFTISYAGITEQDVITLNGIASTVSASPLQLNFPLTKIPASSTLDVTLTNSGAAAVAITSVSTATPYSEADSCGGVVPGNGSCVLHVSFTPRTTQFPVTGTLNIALADGAQYVVGLSGTGTGPVVSLSAPFGTTFGSLVLGTGSNPLSVTIFNSGDQPLNISSISIDGDFTQTNDCPTSLQFSCQVTIKFAPTAVGTRVGVLSVTDDGLGSPQTLQFSGVGTDFQVSAPGGASATVVAGQTAVYNLSFAAVGTFSGQVQVSCTGAPQLATCLLSSPTVSLIGSVPVPVTVTVRTTPHASAAISSPLVFAGLNFVALIGLLPLTLVSKKVRKSAAGRGMLLMVCVVALVFITSCGGGTNSPTPTPAPTQGGTPAGTYTLTVTATEPTGSGTVTRQTNLTLVVQ